MTRPTTAYRPPPPPPAYPDAGNRDHGRELLADGRRGGEGPRGGRNEVVVIDALDEEILTLMHEGALTACQRHIADIDSRLQEAHGAEGTRFYLERRGHWRALEARIPSFVEAIRRAGVGVD